jgi:hypothetical protein
MFPLRHASDRKDLRSRLLDVHLRPGPLPNTKTSFLRKRMSGGVAYNTDPLLLFLIYDIFTCRSPTATFTLAEHHEAFRQDNNRNRGCSRRHRSEVNGIVRAEYNSENNTDS